MRVGFLFGFFIGGLVMDIPYKLNTWAKRKLAAHCIGYPDCDGDLEAEPHSEKCPMYKPSAATEPTPHDHPFSMGYISSCLGCKENRKKNLDN